MRRKGWVGTVAGQRVCAPPGGHGAVACHNVLGDDLAGSAHLAVCGRENLDSRILCAVFCLINIGVKN